MDKVMDSIKTVIIVTFLIICVICLFYFWIFNYLFVLLGQEIAIVITLITMITLSLLVIGFVKRKY